MPNAVKAVPALFVLLWATGFIGARYAMPWAEPFTFLWVRFAITGALLLLLVPFLKTRWPRTRVAFHAGFAGMLIHGVYLGGIFWAIRHGLPAGLAGLIIGLQPMLTAIMAGAFAGERVSARTWVGLVIGLAGVAIVLSPKLGDIAGGVTAATVGAAVAGVVAISFGTVWQKRFVTGADLVATTFSQYAGALVLTLFVALLFEDGQFTITGELVFAMVWLVLVLSLGAIFLLMFLIERGAVARVASLFYLVPAVTAVLAWLLFGETLTLVQIAGMAVTTLGVALATAQSAMLRRAAR